MPVRRVADPRCPELDAQLAGLDPRRELVYRWALMGASPHCRTDSKWKARVAELREELDLDEAGLADALREASALQRDLMASATATGRKAPRP